eukprot:14768984-Alexandrium_andersonii.AAC.1
MQGRAHSAGQDGHYGLERGHLADSEERSISDDQGSIPGDPWGDLFYGLLQACAALEVEEEPLRQGIAARLKMRGAGWAAAPGPPDR